MREKLFILKALSNLKILKTKQIYILVLTAVLKKVPQPKNNRSTSHSDYLPPLTTLHQYLIFVQLIFSGTFIFWPFLFSFDHDWMFHFPIIFLPSFSLIINKSYSYLRLICPKHETLSVLLRNADVTENSRFLNIKKVKNLLSVKVNVVTIENNPVMVVKPSLFSTRTQSFVKKLFSKWNALLVLIFLPSFSFR